MLRESLNKAASEGNDTSADLHKQWASRKKLAKMFVVSASLIPGSFLPRRPGFDPARKLPVNL